MTGLDAGLVAEWDQLQAIQRDYAERCKVIHDHFLRAGFSPDHAMELTLRQLDRVEGWYEAD